MTARRLLPLGLAALAAACTVRELNVGAIPGSGGSGVKEVDAGDGPVTPPPPPAVDILFVIDDSSFARSLQQKLLANFPLLMTRLIREAGFTSLHIGVISTDMGAGDGSLAGCDAKGGKNGILQYTARGSCTTTGLDPGATFISDVDGVKNYTGSREDVFGCIASLGESGCGFEHQFASITRALGADGSPPPAENQGFLRPEAHLLIVIVTDEDDCSAPPDSPLFDTATNTTLESTLGPPGSFRCNEFGHLCNGARPPRLPPSGNAGDVVTLDGCVSAEDQGMLIPVATVATQLRSLKSSSRQQIMIAAITGPATPYTVRWVDRPGDNLGPRPHITASCTATDAGSAAPAVRVNQLLRHFPGTGFTIPACADDYAPTLDALMVVP
jgi:hypothetical protein